MGTGAYLPFVSMYCAAGACAGSVTQTGSNAFQVAFSPLQAAASNVVVNYQLVVVVP